MYISKIELKNIRCFESVTINLEDSGSINRGCVILGDNGMGKTTILRSIAMSIVGQSSASGLLDQIEGGWIRSGADNGHVSITFKTDDGMKDYTVKTVFSRESGDTEIVSEQELTPNEENFWDKIFVAGYGASRGLTGETQYDDYTAYDALFTLFTSESGYLQNPELNIRRIKDAPGANEKLLQILNWIDTILMLPKGSLELKLGGLFLTDRWGRSLPIRATADGYKSMTIVACDLLGWFLLHDEEIFNKELAGIFIIDELEQHLHPSWQRKIVKLLMEVFPKLQFVITTHSPLIAGNAGRLFPEDSGLKLLYAGQQGKISQVSEVEENLGELDCNQILSSEAFGYIINQNDQVGELLKKASELAGKDKKTEKELDLYREIKEKLKKLMFPGGNAPIERDVEKEYYSKLKKEVEEFNKLLEGEN